MLRALLFLFTFIKSYNMKKIFVILGILSLFVMACTPVKIISTERINSHENRRLKTFGFAKLAKTVEVNRANSDQIKAYLQGAIIREMKSRDYMIADSTEQPDILIDLQLNIRDLSDRNEENRYQRYDRYGYGRRYYSPYGFGRYGPADNELDTRSSMQATVTVLIGSSLPEQRLWRGVAMANLAQKSEKSAERLSMIAEQLMANFEK